MYNNIGKRDILIFPKFKNIDLIQNVRKEYDKLANLIPPHITLAFPFSESISNEELIQKLSDLLKKYSSFSVTFKGISLSSDNYIFLDCIKGREKILEIHKDIYETILPTRKEKVKNYIPHITLGKSDSIEKFKNFNHEFSTTIDEISIELIGENEESIILANIKLKEQKEHI